ncbi:MAG: polysaccharide biosynthesis/export family protein [Isosphaeraceae bacterium]|nr:polysaccharide biosynthesis/export family protein [Isosphaeraceae bacterium]
MIARMLPSSSMRAAAWLAAATTLACGSGCRSLGDHEAKRIPQYGIIDPRQPKELEMVSMPPYVVEPPDELEINIRPSLGDQAVTNVVVQADGIVDLGFSGDVYVAGLTLGQIEDKLRAHLAPIAARREIKEPLEVSVRLVNGSQSKFYYVLGTVTTQGRFPIQGNETVLDAILQAGLRTNSLPEKAYLVRPHPTGGADQVLRIDWCGIKERGDTLTNYQLFPGDRIVVPGGKAPSVLSSLLGGG